MVSGQTGPVYRNRWAAVWSDRSVKKTLNRGGRGWQQRRGARGELLRGMLSGGGWGWQQLHRAAGGVRGLPHSELMEESTRRRG